MVEWPLSNLLLQTWEFYLPSHPCFSWAVLIRGAAGDLHHWVQCPSKHHRLKTSDNSITALILTRASFSAALYSKGGCEFKVLEPLQHANSFLSCCRWPFLRPRCLYERHFVVIWIVISEERSTVGGWPRCLALHAHVYFGVHVSMYWHAASGNRI